MSNIVERAKEYATRMHDITNCKYGAEPYSVHLEMVYEAAKKFIHLVQEQDRDKVLAACWAHDVIEDTRQTYNDCKTVLGEDVTEIVYAVTNEMGKNRKERAIKTHPKIKANPLALYVKLADRYANTKASKDGGNRMYAVYKKEMPEFEAELRTDDWPEFWAALLEL